MQQTMWAAHLLAATKIESAKPETLYEADIKSGMKKKELVCRD
jgi:hypothetical protein